jgi:hypothetical protein
MSRNALNQRSLFFGAWKEITWNPRCMLRMCKRFWYSTAIVVTSGPLAHLSFFVGMVDDDRQDNAKAGLAGNH